MQNPLLAQNLGRWAQVYFTTPPEKRDESVRELLRELKAEAAAYESRESVGAAYIEAMMEPGLICTACKGENSATQRFCGFCGLPLARSTDTHSTNEMAHAVKEPVARLPESKGTGFRPSAALDQDRSGSGNEVERLREISFATIYDDAEIGGGAWKFAIAAVVILSAVGAVAYLQFGPQIRAALGIPSPAVQNTSAQATPPAPQTSVTPPAASAPVSNNGVVHPSETDIPPVSSAQAAPQTSTPQPPQTTAAQASSAAQPTDSQNSAQENQEMKASNSPNAPAKASTAAQQAAVTPAAEDERIPASSPPPTDNGNQELSVARQYLGAGNFSEAAQWLWKAVGKKNASALVLLSGLYMRGDGVPKSCDQARVLLVAAAKQGAPDVAPTLRNLETHGCQ